MSTLSNVLVFVLQAITILFIARALVSWFPIKYDSPVRPVVDGVNRLTDPVVLPMRRALPSLGGIDISVFIVVLVIQLFLIPLAQSLA